MDEAQNGSEVSEIETIVVAGLAVSESSEGSANEAEAPVEVTPESCSPEVAPACGPNGEIVPKIEVSPGLLEALLLAHGDPVSLVKLQEVMRCARSELLAALEGLRARLATAECGLDVVQVGERLQLRTKAQHADIVRELMAVKPRKLSQAALETLAVIAYQQPIVKSEIDKIRGVDVAPTIKTLLDRKLVKIIGYQATVGQPSLYGTTDDFLKIFGLVSLAELPSLRDLKALAREPGESGGEGGNESESETEDISDGEGADSEVVQNSGEASPLAAHGVAVNSDSVEAVEAAAAQTGVVS